MLEDIKDDFTKFEQKTIKLHIDPTVSCFSYQMIDVIKEFYPSVDIEISNQSSLPDIVQENYDFALVFSSLRDSGLIARKLAGGELGLFGHTNSEKKIVIIPKELYSKISKVDGFEQIVDQESLQYITVGDFNPVSYTHLTLPTKA